VVLRGVGLAVAIALSAVGLWLMITTTDTKVGRLGMLAVLWGLLIGAFAMFGSRRSTAERDAERESTAEPAAPAAPPAVAPSPGALELRSKASEVERAEEAARRRAFEARLEEALRHEIQASVAREVAALREEIAALRSELLESVGGQLRLERIETTRVIGSDLEALQHELRELKNAASRDGSAAALQARVNETTSRLSRIVEPARARPEPMRPEPARTETPRTETRTETQWRIENVPRPEPRPEPATPRAEAPPRPAPAPSSDPLAGLPRISPFTEFELDPTEDDDSYTGRRRRREDPDDGRHSRGEAPEAPGGRRRAPENGDDLLARLLARESAGR
jgi:hypothetical protein